MKIKLESLLKCSCACSHDWIKKNQSKGLRCMVRNLFRHRAQWMQEFDAWCHLNYVTYMLPRRYQEYENATVIRRLDMMGSAASARKVIDLLDKYKVSDILA